MPRQRPWIERGLCVMALLGSVACSPFGPSCREEVGDVLRASGTVAREGVATYTVVSPKHSNLIITISWSDAAAVLGLRATITDCGAHTGCQMLTSTPSPPVSGTTQGTSRRLLVDGTRGKTYRLEVVSDPSKETTYTLAVTYDISCES